MRFIDMNDDKIINTSDLYKEYKEFSKEDPYNHSETFKAEYFNILMATINGRNDMDIIGMKPIEIEHIIKRIRKAI